MEDKKGVTRRQFLVTGAAVVGASALCMSGARLAIQEPQVDYLSTTYDSTGEKKVLVAYATLAGSTGEISGEIGKILSREGYTVDVKRVDDIRDISGYQSIVIGSAIHSKTWLPEAVEFVKTYQQALSKMPVAYFTCSITMINPDIENVQQEVDAFIAPALQEIPQVKPVAIGHFAGVLDFDKLPFVYRLVWPLTPGGKTKQGDYRDPAAIQSWAASLAPVLI